VNEELEDMWNEAVVICVTVLVKELSGGLREAT